MMDYLNQFHGNFKSAMQWSHLDDLWHVLREEPSDWYVYAIGETVPTSPLKADLFMCFLDEMQQLLRTEHGESYCGIVYADNLVSPQMIKIYDPNNLGVSCGYSENPPLPGWVISRTAPVNLSVLQKPPKNRQRWWRKLFTHHNH